MRKSFTKDNDFTYLIIGSKTFEDLFAKLLQTCEQFPTLASEKISHFIFGFHKYGSSSELFSQIEKQGEFMQDKKRKKFIHEILTQWLERFGEEFFQDISLQLRLTEFSTRYFKPKVLNQFKEIIEAKKSKLENILILSSDSSDQKFLSFLKRTPCEIADHLTYIHIRLFEKVQFSEFFENAWQKPDKATRAPNLSIISSYFNQISSWVSTAVLLSYQLKPDRVTSFFIKVCKELYKLHNFHSLLAIISGLTNVSVNRLEDSWKIDKDLLKVYEMISSKMSPLQNYVMYRAHLAHCRPPYLPCLPVILSDITFIHSGNNDFTENNSINWEKISLLGQQLQIVHISQANLQRYKLKISPKLLNYFTHLEGFILEDEKLYHLSTGIQPIKFYKTKSLVETNLPSHDKIKLPSSRHFRQRSKTSNSPTVTKSRSSPDLNESFQGHKHSASIDVIDEKVEIARPMSPQIKRRTLFVK